MKLGQKGRDHDYKLVKMFIISYFYKYLLLSAYFGIRAQTLYCVLEHVWMHVCSTDTFRIKEMKY